MQHQPEVRNIDSLAHWARVLGIPAGLLWFDLPGSRRLTSATVNALFDSHTGVVPSLDLQGGDWTGVDSHELAVMLREGAELPISAETVTHVVHAWLVTEPPQIAETESGRRIGENLMSKVENRTAELRRIDDYVAGGDLHTLVEKELHATAALLREASYTEALGRRRLVAVGELAQLAGWVLGDAGRYVSAAHYYLVGVKAAHAAGDAALAANLVSTLAYQVSNVGSPREAVLLARSADTGARAQVSPRAQALFKERLAWAHAKAGERRQAERALAAVETAYERGTNDSDPEWSTVRAVVTTRRLWCEVATSRGYEWVHLNYDQIVSLDLTGDALALTFAQCLPRLLAGEWAPWCAAVVALRPERSVGGSGAAPRCADELTVASRSGTPIVR